MKYIKKPDFWFMAFVLSMPVLVILMLLQVLSLGSIRAGDMIGDWMDFTISKSLNNEN